MLSLPSPRVYPQLFRRDDLLDKRKPTEPAREVHAGNQTQTASSFFAGSRFLRTRLWHLSNLQRCLHGSTHGSVDTATGYQPSTLAHSPPKKSCFIKTGTMCFAWDKALKMFSHTTSQFNIPLLSLSAFCFFFWFQKSAAAGSARSLRTRHSSQPTTLKLDTLQGKHGSAEARREERSRLKGKERSRRAWISVQNLSVVTKT